MNKPVLGFGLLLCVAFAVRYLVPPADPTPSPGPAVDLAQEDLREKQRAAAAAEVKRIVAEAHPSTSGEDDPELLRARNQRLEAMAEAVRHALATPTPEAKASETENLAPP